VKRIKKTNESGMGYLEKKGMSQGRPRKKKRPPLKLKGTER